MTAEFMSDVESDDDGKHHRTITWRKDGVSKIIQDCDKRRGAKISYKEPSPSAKANPDLRH